MGSSQIVEWRLPPRICVGESLPVHVVVHGEGGTKVDRATLKLEGLARFAGSGDASERTAPVFAKMIELVTGEGKTIILGDPAEWTAAFEIPADAGTSFVESERGVGIEWKLTLDVSIPWRFDISDERIIQVEAPAAESAGERESEERRAIIGFNSGLRAEMLFDDCRIAPGEEVRGRIALYNIRGRSIYNFDVIAAFIVAHVYDDSNLTQVVKRVEPPALALRGDSASAEGVEHDFTLRIPAVARTMTKCRSDHHNMRMFWAARIEIEHEDGSERTDVELDVQPFLPRTKELPRASNLAIGPARWREVLETVAERNGMAFLEESDSALDLALAAKGEIEGEDVTLRLEGPLLAAATVSFPEERMHWAQAFAKAAPTVAEFHRVEKIGNSVTLEREIAIGHSVDRLEAFLVDVRRGLVSCSLLVGRAR